MKRSGWKTLVTRASPATATVVDPRGDRPQGTVDDDATAVRRRGGVDPTLRPG